MYNLQRFILKHHFVILFILLEVISILLLARSQNFHRNRMVNTTNDAVGKIYEWGSEVGNYFRLNTANERAGGRERHAPQATLCCLRHHHVHL